MNKVVSSVINIITKDKEMDTSTDKFKGIGLDPRLLGQATCIDSQVAYCSAARSAMRSSFLTQMLVLEGSTKRKLVTGAEREYAKYTVSIEAPCDARVRKIIRKYPETRSIYNFKKNPETTIIYESMDDSHIGCITVPSYYCNHKVFGFEYRHSNIMRNLTVDSILSKGDILAYTPSVDADGDYKYGIETNTAFMSVPGVIEDGVVVSESYCKRLRTKGYSSVIVDWGRDNYPLNLYGDDNDYKAFPDIGDRARPDGILYALRKYDPILAVCDMTVESLQEVNHTFDDVCYIQLSSVSSDEMPIVEDITVWRNHNSDTWKTPITMCKQVSIYNNAVRLYNTLINDFYSNEFRKNPEVKLSNEFHRKVVDANINDNSIQNKALPKSLARTFRRTKLDDWRVEIHYGWTITPGIGYKVTDLQGGKGVICAVWPDEHMPVDDFGKRADMIVDGESTCRRTNFSRFNEHYINATSDYILEQVKALHQNNQLLEAYQVLLDYYSVVSPRMYDVALLEIKNDNDRIKHVNEVVQEGIQIWRPQDTPDTGVHFIKQLMDKYPLPRSPVTYTDLTGKKVRTVKNVLIGSLYILLLEKIGDDWGATSIPKRQHHGIPGKLTDTDKLSLPWREQSFKIFGESEARLLLGTLQPEFVGAMMNFPNSPAMCMEVAQRILTADKPANMDYAMDYSKHVDVSGRSLQYFNHILETSGIDIIMGDPHE